MKTKCNDGVSASDLLYRISIEEKTTTKGVTAGSIYTWAEHAEVSAKIDWKSGNENEEETKQTAKTKVWFTIRYLSTVTKEMRINYDSMIFEIRTVLRKGRKQYLEVRTELIE